MIDLKPIKALGNWRGYRDREWQLLSGTLYKLTDHGEGFSLLLGSEYIRGGGYYVYDIWTGCVIQRYSLRKDMLERLPKADWYTIHGEVSLPVWILKNADESYIRKQHFKARKETELLHGVSAEVAHYLIADTLREAMEVLYNG